MIFLAEILEIIQFYLFYFHISNRLNQIILSEYNHNSNPLEFIINVIIWLSYDLLHGEIGTFPLIE